MRGNWSEWIEKRNINLLQPVQEAINEEMEPTDKELVQAYRENAEHAAEIAEQ